MSRSASAQHSTPPPAAEQRPSLIIRIAQRYSVDPDKLAQTLKATVFKSQPRKDGTVREATNEELMMLLVIADQYNLNPFTREIYAFFDEKRGGIVPIVSIDGWIRIITELLHALRPLDALNQLREQRAAERAADKALEPTYGLDEIHRTFTRAAEDYGHGHRFDYEYEGPMPHERRGHIVVTGCALIGRRVEVELPLAMFSHSDLEMVAEEIEEALREAAEQERADLDDEQRGRRSAWR